MKRICILMFSLLILFASYSCVKKSKALRPDVTHDLTMSIDYYGEKTPPSSESPIVQVSYTKNIVSAENESDLVPIAFSDEKLLEGVIQIPEKAEVTITINPVTPATDGTLINYLLGDVPSDFDPKAREYIFTMDTNKSFEVVLSEAPIEMLDFKFEVVGNGAVEISSTKTGQATATYTVTESSPQTVSIVKSDFNSYTIVAEAKPNAENKFSAWSGKGSGTSTTLPINNANMEGTITATFVAETKYSFTFATSGTTGTIEVVATNKTDSTDRKTLLSSGTGSTLQIGELTFRDYNVTVKASAGSGQAFDKWSYNNSTANPLTITSAMAGTITANFIAIPAGTTFTFSSGANGAIYLFFLNSDDSVYSNVRVAGPSENNKTATITGSLFANYKVEARAIGIVGYGIDRWNGNSSDTAEVKVITSSSPTTQSATFKTVTINYGTGTLPTKNGDGWYEIYNKDELIYVANKVNAGDATFQSGKYRLMDNIDYKGAYHLPIGGNSDFSGVIDGNNKVISNAKFGKSYYGEYTGFIGIANYYAKISNLTIDSSCVINSSAHYVGSIVACAAYSSSIYNSVNKADIQAYGSEHVAGIAGYASGTISNVYNTGNIYVDSGFFDVYVGGIIGRASANPLYLKNAYNTGDVTYKGSTANTCIGGVIGYVVSSLYITNVYNSGTVTSLGETKYTGGVFGNVINSSYTFDAKNVYFTGNASLPAGGFGSGSDKLSDANVVGRIGSLSGLHTTFNSAGMGNVWASGPGGRPVIKGLGEGAGY